jgi:hypothetical protein
VADFRRTTCGRARATNGSPSDRSPCIDAAVTVQAIAARPRGRVPSFVLPRSLAQTLRRYVGISFRSLRTVQRRLKSLVSTNLGQVERRSLRRDAGRWSRVPASVKWQHLLLPPSTGFVAMRLLGLCELDRTNSSTSGRSAPQRRRTPSHSRYRSLHVHDPARPVDSGIVGSGCATHELTIRSSSLERIYGCVSSRRRMPGFRTSSWQRLISSRRSDASRRCSARRRRPQHGGLLWRPAASRTLGVCPHIALTRLSTGKPDEALPATS